MRSAAERALVGSDADVHTFLMSGYQLAAELDERITVDRMLADGGVATKTAAQQDLDATDPGARYASSWIPAGTRRARAT